MPGIQSVEKSACFGTAHLTNNDPVRPMAENGFKQIIEADRALVCVQLSLGGDDVRFSDGKLCRVFNDQNAVSRRGWNWRGCLRAWSCRCRFHPIPGYCRHDGRPPAVSPPVLA